MAEVAIKSSKEIADEQAKYLAEADQLQTKSRTASLTAEEDVHLDKLIADAENLEPERIKSAREERIVASKERMAQPVKPAPRFAPEQYRSDSVSFGDGLSLWLGSKFEGGDKSPEAQYKARMAGFDLNRSSVKIPFRYDAMNFKTRTMLSKGGSLTGADYIYNTYSQRVTEYLTALGNSPLLGLVSVETTEDGNKRVYWIVDDTALTSSFITDSSGTEISPTNPAKNIATKKVEMQTLDIVSGVHQASAQELRDSGVTIPDKVAKAAFSSHRRKIEHELVNATGNGLTAPMGILDNCQALSAVARFDESSIENLYFSVSTPYRGEAIFLSNSATYQLVREGLKDDINRSKLQTMAQEGIEWDTLKGKRYVVSEAMPDGTLAFFNPNMFILRFVNGQTLKTFDELYWPAVGWSSMVSFGTAYIGADSIKDAYTLSLI